MNPNHSHPSYQAIKARAEHRNPGKTVDMSHIDSIDPALLDAYQGKDRVRVRRVYPGGEVWERTGRVSVSLGWGPTLLLMTRSNQLGSSDVLGAGDQVVAIWDGRQYHPLDADDGPYSARTPYTRALNAKRAELGLV